MNGKRTQSSQEKQQQLTEQRHQAQQKDEQVRAVEQKRLAWQAAKSDREHYLEQLKRIKCGRFI